MCVYVVPSGALLEASQKLLARGIHPARISDSLLHFTTQALTVLEGMAIPVDLSDRTALLNSANTALNSKVCELVIEDITFTFK